MTFLLHHQHQADHKTNCRGSTCYFESVDHVSYALTKEATLQQVATLWISLQLPLPFLSTTLFLTSQVVILDWGWSLLLCQPDTRIYHQLSALCLITNQQPIHGSQCQWPLTHLLPRFQGQTLSPLPYLNITLITTDLSKDYRLCRRVKMKIYAGKCHQIPAILLFQQ